MSLIKRAYKYRCYPTTEQRQVLARTFGCCRWVYNQALACKTTAYRKAGQRLFYSHLSALLPVWKTQEETVWLGEVSSVPLQQSLRHLDRAFVNFFEGRAKYPKFKRKHGSQAATYTVSAFGWHEGQLTPAKMQGALPIRWSRPLPEGAVPSTVTVSRDAADRYFVSLLVEAEVAPLPTASAAVGVDLGLSDVFTLSTGEKTGNERFFRKEEKRLARLQRRHARKHKGSKNREKARRRVAKLHARIADRRRDFQHKLSTRVIRENQVSLGGEPGGEADAAASDAGQGDCRCGLGRVAPAVGLQSCVVWAHPDQDGSLVSLQQNLFGLWAGPGAP